jgi:hypothetical protein
VRGRSVHIIKGETGHKRYCKRSFIPFHKELMLSCLQGSAVLTCRLWCDIVKVKGGNEKQKPPMHATRDEKSKSKKKKRNYNKRHIKHTVEELSFLFTKKCSQVSRVMRFLPIQQ